MKNPCTACPERQRRIRVESEEAGLRWVIQKLRNRLRELSQQTQALALTADEGLMKPRFED